VAAEDHGRHSRSFTYVDDIVEGVIRTLDRPAAPDPGWTGNAPNPATSKAPYRLFNIGAAESVELLRYVDVLEEKLGRKAIRELVPLQPGDVPDTEASVTDLAEATGYAPRTTVEEGVGRFVDWYREYYGI
jgi:UDP-glucuronate 4-epimerase